MEMYYTDNSFSNLSYMLVLVPISSPHQNLLEDQMNVRRRGACLV